VVNLHREVDLIRPTGNHVRASPVARANN
jgi:hypothetical protein